MSILTDAEKKKRQEFEAQIVGPDDETIGEYSRLFDLVKNKENWKYPIKARVKKEEAEKFVRAIEWFAGGPTTQKLLPRLGVVILENSGYYINIGA